MSLDSIINSPPSKKVTNQFLNQLDPSLKLIRIRSFDVAFANTAHIIEALTPNGSPVSMVVKRYREADIDSSKKARIEFEALQMLMKHGVPAPEALFLDACGDVFDVPAIVTQFVPGKQILEPATPESWAIKMARTLAKIHSIPLEESYKSDFLDGDYEVVWFLRGDMPDYMAAHPDGEDVWNTVNKLQGSLDRPSSSLMHVDYWPGNILWHQDEISAVLDWEEAAYGTPAYDVAYCRMDMMVSGFGAVADEFLKAYEAEIGSRVDDLGYWELVASVRALHRRLTVPTEQRNLRYFIADAMRRIE